MKDMTSLNSSRSTEKTVSKCVRCLPKRRRPCALSQEIEPIGSEEDLISSLPNDILIHMLSFIDLKQVGRTSILSKRWRYVWTLISDLNFDGSEALKLWLNDDPGGSPDSMDRGYVNWVNQVLNANRCQYINSFRVYFWLDSRFTADIDNWVKIVLDKRVHKFELSFLCHSGIPPYRTYCLSSCFSLHPQNYSTLESLHLGGVIISQQMINSILSNCHNLQSLSLQAVDSSFGKFTIIVSSIKLKHLEISRCFSFRKITIIAPNLISFAFFERDTYVEYLNVESLVEVAFAGSFCCDIICNPHLISGFSSQQEKVSLGLSKVCCVSSGFTAFSNVKQLELAIMPTSGRDLLDLISFIGACPLLHTFKLKLLAWVAKAGPVSVVSEAQVNIMRSHQHLKIVEVVGFPGSGSTIQIVLCLAENLPMLNKIIFDPRLPEPLGEPLPVNDDDFYHITYRRRQSELLEKRIQDIGRDIDIIIM